MLKRAAAYFLISAFLFNTFGFWIFFQFELNAIHAETEHAIRAAIIKKSSRIISIPENSSELAWTSANKEFRYRGTMYDVIHIEKKNGWINIYCIDDERETRLLAHADEIAESQSQHHPSRHHPGKVMKRFFSLRYLPAAEILFCPENNSSVNFPDYISFYSFSFSSPPSPPPWRTV